MSGMVKMLDFAPVNDYGESIVRIIGNNKASNVKVASSAAFAPAIQEFIAALQPLTNKIYALINAMGASEFYGCNRNGDAFYEDALKEKHDTFVSKGKPFMHHLNKEGDKAYGKVIASAYNDVMHRVELIVEYDTEDLDDKYVKKLNDGDVVNVSMGCKVPYDVCSICGNKAKTPAEYCSHLTSSPGLGRMMDDGRKAFAINTKPEFFDISIVTIPADPTARVLTKIASAQTTSSVQRAKELLSVKTAEGATTSIDNDAIMGGMQSLLSRFDGAMGPDFPKDILDRIGGLSSDPFSILKGLINKKVFLRPNETQRIVLVSVGKKDLADNLDDNKLVMMNHPGQCMDHLSNAIGDRDLDSVLPQELSESRELAPKNIKRIIIKMCVNPEKTASLEQVPISDSFRSLMGEDEIKSAPTFLEDPLGALKTYLAIGSIVAAFNTMLGRATSGTLLKNVGIGSLLSGPMLLDALHDVSEAPNRPSQEMMFMNPDDPGRVRAAIMQTIEEANMLNAANLRSGTKLGSFGGLGSNFGSRALLSIPLAYGASKLISNEAKKSAIEESAYTGKYSPGFLSKPEYTLPLSLALLLKYASADKMAETYVKTASTLFSGKYGITKKDLMERLNDVLFK